MFLTLISIVILPHRVLETASTVISDMIAKNVLSSAVRSMFGIVGSSRWSLDLLEWSEATSAGIIAVSREYAIHCRHFICEVRSDQHSHHVPLVIRFMFVTVQGTGAHSERTHVLRHL